MRPFPHQKQDDVPQVLTLSLLCHQSSLFGLVQWEIVPGSACGLDLETFETFEWLLACLNSN